MVLSFTYIKNVFRCIVLFFLFTLPSSGQLTAQVKFSTVVSPENAAINDYIQVDYVIENARSIENFTPPSFKGLELVQGPSQSSNVTIINGSVSRSQTFSYVLQSQAAGKFTIPGAIAIIDGKTIRSNPVTIEIDGHPGTHSSVPQRRLAPSVSPMFPDLPEFRPNMGEDYKLLPGEDPKDKIAKNLFVKLIINKTTCYVGEPVLATYKLYARLGSEAHVSKNPTLNGFSVYEMKSPTEATREEVNGREYNVQTVRKVQLLPLQEGSYTVDPVELESRVDFVRVPENASSNRRTRSNNPMQRLIDEFFGRGEEEGTLETHTATLKSEPVVIKVLPLPDNKPAGFKGAVGKFTLSATLKKPSIKAGDVAELDVTIQGKGNIPMISAPQIDLPDNMESFDPSIKDEVNNSVYPLSGAKTIAYTFLVNKEGDYTIPPVRFSYFDPVAKTYKTLQSDTFSIHAAHNSALAAEPAPGKKDADTEVPSSKWTDIIGVEMVVGAIIILTLLGIIIYLLKKNQVKTPAPAIQEAKAADSPAPVITGQEETVADPLQDARTALVEGDHQKFYSEVNKALREAVHRNTDTSSALLTKTNMSFILREKGVAEDTVLALEALMNKCEIALYTPVQQERDKVAILEKAESILRDLERSSREALVGS